MPLSSIQKHDIEDVIQTLLSVTSSRGKRRLSDMFLELVDKEFWPEYYEVIVCVSYSWEID